MPSIRGRVYWDTRSGPSGFRIKAVELRIGEKDRELADADLGPDGTYKLDFPGLPNQPLSVVVRLANAAGRVVSESGPTIHTGRDLVVNLHARDERATWSRFLAASTKGLALDAAALARLSVRTEL